MKFHASPSSYGVRVGLVFAVVALFLGVAHYALAQATLGFVNGTVADSSGALIQGAQVRLRAIATNLVVTAETKADGAFSAADLPIGTYEVRFSKDGFQAAVYPQIIVQGNHTTTIDARLKPGVASENVTVEATPLLNETDTTTGYVLDNQQLSEIPLGTGSFTQTAILSPGVSADFLNTAGTNAGLGNQAIWANGQRDTSNSFLLNGVSANNVFNGKSTSQVTSGRVAVNIGEQGNGNNPSGEIVTSTSVYGAIGQALPSPPPETIQELHVSSAMYDASQGANSGAHLELATKSGANAIHGGAYDYYEDAKWNANQWFYNNNQLQRPPLHRETFGGYVGGPIKKDKLFYFGSYQGLRASDALLATSLVAVPPDLTSDRSPGGATPAAGGLAAVVDKDFIGPCGGGGSQPACFDPSTITPQALAIMQTKAPDGSFFVPNAATGNQLATLQGQSADAVVQGGASSFRATQVNANLDYYVSSADRLAAKYYFQDDPNTTPFANSQLLGFPQTMHAGSQTISLDNITTLGSNNTWEQRFGFIRERAYSQQTQFLTPAKVGINLLGKNVFPSINLHNADGLSDSTAIGPATNFANTGWFQNNFEWASSFQSVHGRHSLSTGFNLDYTQTNIINRNDQLASLNFADFPGFLQGKICSPTVQCNNQPPSELLTGATSRHYRTKQIGAYGQDKLRVTPNLTLDLGVRWDWNGPLYEINGLLENFYPQDYSYNVASDTIQNVGLVIAGNNKAFGTKGVNNSTLTGRQWGFAPRVGLAYSPAMFNHKVVVRAGFGMYYDRGEYFTELSPPSGGGISGPFGVTVEEPFVVPFFAVANATFATPFGTTPPPAPPANFSTVKELLPNAANLINQTTQYCIANSLTSGCGPLLFGGYDPKATLPYSENWTLDLQWQPKNDLVMILAYVGNHGVHETIPLPFNQARIATPQHPLLQGGPSPQIYSYGYNMNCFAIFPCTESGLQAGPLVLPAENVNALVAGAGTGNAALRVPYIGYDPNSDFNRTVGMSNYDALQLNVSKRLSRGLQVTGSYTYSHTLDEQSGLGLFYNGNDPNNPRTSYGNSDYDRTHVLTVSYHYDLPTMSAAHGWLGQIVNGWGFNGLTVLQSGQPYSVIDFSGGVASIYWGGGQDQATNPIVPVGGVGATSKNPLLQGTTGIDGTKPVLNPNAFGPVPAFAPGTNGVPPCNTSTTPPTCDTFENGYTSGGRNIFRGPFQNRWDLGAFKSFKLSERVQLKYDVNAFNIFNHPSFDIPNNNVDFNAFCNPPGPNFSCSSIGYAFPPKGHLGVLAHTIGSPRFIQMALHLTF